MDAPRLKGEDGIDLRVIKDEVLKGLEETANKLAHGQKLSSADKDRLQALQAEIPGMIAVITNSQSARKSANVLIRLSRRTELLRRFDSYEDIRQHLEALSACMGKLISGKPLTAREREVMLPDIVSLPGCLAGV